MSRPTLLLLALSFANLLAATTHAQTVSTQVSTSKGTVEGEAVADGKVLAFKGIPFAAPPTGSLRWAPPAPAAPWTGIRPAKDFGYHCVQSVTYPDMTFHDPGPSEDCLTLNVWAPAGAKPGSLPVMVWIYGGGFAGGGTSESRQDGQVLAQRGVILVSMNYRLGIFGFFTHPGLTAESSHHASGNYGLMDQTAAIQWVHDNIAAFGGDPANVTVFGESAGSFSVSLQMATPLARGLFQKAIGESGGALVSASLPEQPRSQRETADASFALTTYGTSSIAALRRLSTEDIVHGIATASPKHSFGLATDGYFLPQSAAKIYAAGAQAHIPLLAGWNAGEGRSHVIGVPGTFSAEGFAALAAHDFPGRSAEFLKLYPATTEPQALESAVDYIGDQFIAYSTWRWLEAQVATGQAPVFRYRFDLPTPGDKFHSAFATGAFHSDEIEYVFGTLYTRPETTWRPEDRALSAQMQLYWTNFARTGNPNGTGLPTWPAYTSAGWNTMHLNAISAPKPDALRDRYLFLNSAWDKSK